MNVIQHNKVAHLHNDKDIIFCKTDYLEVLFYNLRDCKDNVTLITGNSDYAITNDIVSKAPPCIKLWFGQAMNSTWGICRSLPYGIENSEHCILGQNQGYGHPGATYKLAVMENPPIITPTKSVYANFSRTSYSGRPRVADICKKLSYITYDIDEVVTVKPYASFVSNILDHKMVVCPRGNAPAETHRFWEVLYLGRVPIVKYKFGLCSFTDLPVIVLSDWDQLQDEEFILKEYDRIKDNSKEKLDMDYWITYIKEEHGKL